MVLTRAAADAPRLADLPALPRPGRVLMTTPAHFEVAYVINPHMEGNAGTVDQAEAHRQWTALADTYRRLGLGVAELGGVYGLADMVFCANQTLPFTRPDGARGVVLSRMNAEQRKGEVPHYAEFFAGQDYEVHRLDDEVAGTFEGMGDALWHPGRRLLWGGYGFRTDRGVYDRLADFLDAAVCALRLDDPDFYHLDTCLAPLDEQTRSGLPRRVRRGGPRAHSPLFRAGDRGAGGRGARAVRLQRALPGRAARDHPKGLHRHEQAPARGRVRAH